MSDNKTDPKTAELDALMSEMPSEIIECVQKHGFDKLAAAVFGLPEINAQSVGQFFGTKLATQQREWKEIVSGLKLLETISGG